MKSQTLNKSLRPKYRWLKPLLLFICMCLLMIVATVCYWNTHYLYYGIRSIPLKMTGGDPYLRALMRTISASEANSKSPYTLMYGGQQFVSLGEHPDVCNDIQTEVNKGDCSTAAGRYQMLTSTWSEKSARYHPPEVIWDKKNGIPFSALNQDLIVYNWLNDRKAWNMDIAQRLRQDELSKVLRRLSSTWTSLGYGIENNTTSKLLPSIYAKILKEELKEVQKH